LGASIAGTSASTSGTATSATYPLSSIPALNSLPGAKVSLYLNFVGDYISSWNGYTNITTPVFDQDGDPTTFSSGELAAINTIWQCVAEDYAPFNINVTTVAPPRLDNGVALKVDIGGNGAWFGGGTGISEQGSFMDSTPNVVFAFSNNIGTYAPDIAAVASHEAGHGFGLAHQSVWDSNGNKTAEYNPGPGDGTAPIMGTDFAYWPRPISRWWYGTSDISPTSIQDDMAIIAGTLPGLTTGTTTGIGYRPITVGQTAATATSLTVSGNTLSASGVIESMSQMDYYSLTTGAGSVTLAANVPTGFNDLAPKVLLYNSNGTTLIASASYGANDNATITANLAAGSYLFVVESSGPSSGSTSTNYGFNIGSYTINGTIVSISNTTPPSAPTNLTATAVSTSQVNLTWTDNATNETGYNVERSTGGVNWSTIATGLPAGSTSYTDAAASPGTTYSYLVYAYNSSSTSGNSNQATATTVTVAPSGLTATTVSSSQIGLAWGDVTGETGFRVERSLDGATWGLAGTTGANVTSYQDTSVAASTTYKYRVEATDAGGSSACSNVASATTPATLAPPAAPSGLVAVSTSATSVSLSWHDNSSNENGFYIARSTNNGKSWTQIAQVGAGVTIYTDTSVSARKTYSYRVRAYNGSGTSAYSNVATVTTLAHGPSLDLAPGPGGLAQPSFGFEGTMPITPTWPGPAHRQAGGKAPLGQGPKSSPAIASRFDLVDWALTDWPKQRRVLGQSLKRTT
jgi:hypothetical protein